MKILIHLGMPKCGSSALQSYMSGRDFNKIVGSKYVYVVLHKDGVVKWGDDLIVSAEVNPYGYLSSHKGDIISSYSKSDVSRVSGVIKELNQEFGVVIISNEGWGANPHSITDNCLFATGDYEVSVMAYVRPQVEWMNSAWWQWGAWSDVELKKWIARTREKIKWNYLLQQWSDKSWVSKSDVRLLDGDVVQDFMNYLGFEIPPQDRRNQSLPETVLRLFQRNRELRPGPHDAAIDFTLSRRLNFKSGNTPWVIPQKLIDRYIKYYHQDNMSLVDRLPSGQRRQILDDDRWWKSEPYRSRELHSTDNYDVDAGEVEKLAVDALLAVNRMDAELRKLRMKLVRSKKSLE